MAVSYNKLWKLLIDKNMTKTELIKKSGITTNAMAHLGKNEDVRLEVLVKICGVLGCTIDDIVEIVSD
ncbi:MAG TPA: Cro/Cl family transcriptional regulator [Eubacterium sp.]|nr:Cro/Cl family transcriptional regulator [Eubacterium sp.]